MITFPLSFRFYGDHMSAILNVSGDHTESKGVFPLWNEFQPVRMQMNESEVIQQFIYDTDWKHDDCRMYNMSKSISSTENKSLSTLGSILVLPNSICCCSACPGQHVSSTGCSNSQCIITEWGMFKEEGSNECDWPWLPQPVTFPLVLYDNAYFLVSPWKGHLTPSPLVLKLSNASHLLYQSKLHLLEMTMRCGWKLFLLSQSVFDNKVELLESLEQYPD